MIRPIAPPDHDAWEQLFLEYGVFYKTEFTDEIVAGVWRWLMDARHEVHALVAATETDVVGFAHFRELADTFTAAPSWNLDDLYVAPEARGRGAATALITAVAAHAAAHGGGTLRWITATDNLAAQRVYDAVAARADWVTYELQTIPTRAHN